MSQNSSEDNSLLLRKGAVEENIRQLRELYKRSKAARASLEAQALEKFGTADLEQLRRIDADQKKQRQEQRQRTEEAISHNESLVKSVYEELERIKQGQ